MKWKRRKVHCFWYNDPGEERWMMHTTEYAMPRYVNYWRAVNMVERSKKPTWVSITPTQLLSLTRTAK